MLFHTKITGFKKGEVVGRDRYGDDIFGPPREVTMRAEVITGTTTEPPAPGHIARVIDTFKLALPPSSTLDALDEVKIFGKEYRIEGNPVPVIVAGRLHHFEANIKRITG